MGRFVNPDNSAFQVALNATWDMDSTDFYIYSQTHKEKEAINLKDKGIYVKFCGEEREGKNVIKL